jgi:hypothetical protein
MARIHAETRPRRRPRPSAGGAGLNPSTAVISARVAIDDFALIDLAAEVRGVDRKVIVEQGAVLLAVQTLRQHVQLLRNAHPDRLRNAARRARRRLARAAA